MKRKSEAKPRAMTARDLIRLATRCPPSTPVVVHTEHGADVALYDSDNTGLGDIDFGDGSEPRACIVISTVEPE